MLPQPAGGFSSSLMKFADRDTAVVWPMTVLVIMPAAGPSSESWITEQLASISPDAGDDGAGTAGFPSGPDLRQATGRKNAITIAYISVLILIASNFSFSRLRILEA